MISVNLLDSHSSSPLRIFNHLQELAKRDDLYSGKDFYFGFDSSNMTFLDMIGEHQPLAIKYGSILSLYQRKVEGATCSIYYIDLYSRQLLPLMNIQAMPAATDIFTQLIPFSFIDFYLERTEPQVERVELNPNNPLTAEQVIQSLIEQMAVKQWPDANIMSRISQSVQEIRSKEQGITNELANLPQLKERISQERPSPLSGVIVAPYNPLFDNQRIAFDSLMEANPMHISVRQIDDRYPRIEVISPKSVGHNYTAIYQTVNPDLYELFKANLGRSSELEALLKEHFSEIANDYASTSVQSSVGTNGRL
jgi:hypothetical protein